MKNYFKIDFLGINWKIKPNNLRFKIKENTS